MQRWFWPLYAIIFLIMLAITTYNVNQVIDTVVDQIVFGKDNKVCE